MSGGPVSIIKRNLAANFAGVIVTAVLSLAVVPIYLRLLGAEAYGLVGFYTVLQALFAVFDFGLGTAVNRETARLSVGTDNGAEAHTLVRTLEVLYGGAAVVIATICAVAAPRIAAFWLNTSTVGSVAARDAIIVMGLTVALQFPIGLYTGVLLGLQRHGVLNAWTIAGALMRLLVPLLLFTLFGATIAVYFAWQAVAALIHTVALRAVAMRALPRAERSAIDFTILRKLQSFAAGVTGITFLAALVMQIDKLAVSRFSTLGDLGYYTAAATLAGGVLMISGPVAAAVFPRFSQFVGANDLGSLATLYHRASQFVAALLLPIAVVVAVFPAEILIAWTRDVAVAARAGVPLTLLVIALTANALAAVPYALQLAFGWTSLALGLNVAGVVVLVPATILAASRSGAAGAAAAVCVWHLLALVISMTLMHRRILPGALWRWLARDLAPPLLASVAVAAGVRFLMRAPGAPMLALIAAMTLAASLAATPLTWLWLRERRRAWR